MNKPLFYPAIIVLILAGCRQRENVSQLKEINESLIKVCELMADNNRFVYNEMKEKLVDPQTRDRALIWQPKAEVIKRRASAVKVFIDSLKAVLIKQSDSLKIMDNDIVEQMLETNKKGTELFDKLVMFNDSIDVVFNTKEFVDNPFILEVLKRDSVSFGKNVSLILGFKDSSIVDNRIDFTNKWISKNFANCSSLMATTVLSKMEADVTRAENCLIGYCNSMVVNSFCGYDSFWGIATISSSKVKPGDTVVVTAGVGAFGDLMHPRILIDGEAMRLNNKKVAVYVFTANRKPGKYTVPVKLHKDVTAHLKVVIEKEAVAE